MFEFVIQKIDKLLRNNSEVIFKIFLSSLYPFMFEHNSQKFL